MQQRRLDEARRLADGRVSMWVGICGVNAGCLRRWREREWSKKDAKSAGHGRGSGIQSCQVADMLAVERGGKYREAGGAMILVQV